LKNCQATRSIGIELDELREARRQADYDLARNFSYTKAKEYVDAAQSAVTEIEKAGLASLTATLNAHLTK